MNNVFYEFVAFHYAMAHPDLMSVLKLEFFTEPTLRNIFPLVQDFVAKYRSEPSREQVEELVRTSNKADLVSTDSLNNIWENFRNHDTLDPGWMVEGANNWVNWRNFFTNLEKTIAYVQTLPATVEVENTDTYIEKAKTMFGKGTTYCTGTKTGHDFFDVETHQLTQLHTRSTGYPFIDKAINGGWFDRSLIIFMGSPKAGKSMWLCNLAANSVKNGHNTIYITLELAYQKVSQRIGANMFNIPIQQYNNVLKDTNYFGEKVKFFNNSQLTKHGEFVIEEYPTSTATASAIESFILKKQEEMQQIHGPNFKFQDIYIDYLNIMRDMKNPNSENMYLKIKSICEDVRAMAQRNEWCVISVTQTNRGGTEASDLNMTDVSESAGLSATVDALFGIIRTTMMRAEGYYYLKAIAMRDSPYMGCKKRFRFSDEYLRITEDDTEDIIQDGVDLPAIYTSATANGVSKMQNNRGGYYNQPQQPAMQQPPANMPYGQPQMGISESQLTGVNLFNL